MKICKDRHNFGISNFLEEISNLSHSIVSSISLHWSLKKAFLSLLAILWNFPFKWVYLSFSPLPFASLLFIAICKASSDNHFAFLHFFFLGMVLIPASYTMSQTSIHSSSGTLSDLIPWIFLSMYNWKGIWFRSYLNGLVVFLTFFHLSLNLARRSSWSEPQSAAGLIFADYIKLLQLWLQRIESVWSWCWPSGDVHV